MAKRVVQTLVTPRNVERWYYKKQDQDATFRAHIESLVQGKATFTTETTELESGNLQIVTTHVFANDSDYDAYITGWTSYDAERLAYHTENGQTYTRTVTDE